MTDREKVITHLQIIHTWATFARERDLQFFTPKHLEDIAQWSYDTIELLKEQEIIIESIKSDLAETLDVVANRGNVVRCKDCKFRDPEDRKCDSGHGIVWNMPRPDDWFCADGEPKESR